MKRVLKFNDGDMANRFVKYMKASDENLTVESEKLEDEGCVQVKYDFPEFSTASEEKDEPTKEYIEREELFDILRDFRRYFVEYIGYEMNWIASEIRYLENAFYRHQNGHLPAIEGAGKMERALETLGIKEDYEVEKKRIFATSNNTKRSIDIELDLED